MMKRESRYGRGVLETEVVSQLKNLGVRTGYLRRSVDSHAGLTWYTSQGRRGREREGGGVLVGSTWGCPKFWKCAHCSWLHQNECLLVTHNVIVFSH